MKTINVKDRKNRSKCYHWSSSSNTVYRDKPGLFESKTKIGSAKNLEDAIALIKSHAGNVKSIEVK